MTPKNIALEPDVLEQVGKLAEQQGKTADELMNEAALRLLEAQTDVNNLRSFVARNRQRAEGMGLKESDVQRLIAEDRAARRR
jgi:hypothetical protein